MEQNLRTAETFQWLPFLLKFLANSGDEPMEQEEEEAPDFLFHSDQITTNKVTSMTFQQETIYENNAHSDVPEPQLHLHQKMFFHHHLCIFLDH